MPERIVWGGLVRSWAVLSAVPQARGYSGLTEGALSGMARTGRVDDALLAAASRAVV
jgi:hypothetical protein